MDQEWRKLFDAGNDALREGNFKQAEQCFFGALAEAERFGDKDSRLANTLEQLVEANWYAGQFGQVEAHARRLLLLYQNTVGPDHFKTACVSYRLANLYHYEQKLGLAEPLYKQVTTVMMKWLGSNHPELARIMDDYADLLHATHRADQAEYIKRCAESIKTRLLQLLLQILLHHHRRLRLPRFRRASQLCLSTKPRLHRAHQV
jgi:hypothetical protein